ncbi:hypothetical protein HALLA_01770 (plasmid) [Halostagnicola larsenii XH-48]|uniref:Uncharacterized protein n=1 Tax=Halostagnicola larsenii XH-48 TaxID=797299 RepID=W0JTX4_9EURY|nr:hypothetical protein HALLA_01770 [Halostagnicola larsenii XH-48]
MTTYSAEPIMGDYTGSSSFDVDEMDVPVTLSSTTPSVQ